MSIAALKCQIVVQAGFIPGEPLKEFTRAWSFDAALIEACTEDPTDYRYMDGMGSAMNYAASLQHPGLFNWVSVEWIWM